MEAKRLGLCQKSLFVVPNHLTEQWASEFLRLYPSANILVTTKKDFETHNRKKFCARIATGDYDAIIMGHSQFEKIPISHERQERLLQEQIDEINMKPNDLNTALYEKMAAEQDKYRDWLKSQSPAEVLNHAYEYTVREDIVMAMEELELTDAQAQALLDSPTPLADVYRHFEKVETDHMDVIRDSIENRADDVCKAQAELRKAAIYPHSAAYAKEHGELEQYRASNNANLQCKEAIEAAVREHFDGMYLSHDAARGVIQTYGMDRVMLVLANTVQLQDWDGRYSRRNKEWAKTIPNYNSDTVRRGYALNSHPAVLDGFIDLVREEQLRRQPLTVEDIQAEAERILRELRAPDEPNSPHGTHYMARISPEFLNRAGSDACDWLMNLLPFRSLTFTGIKGLPGTYATILAGEDRTKELRQPRSSVREHLKQEPKQAAPKAPVHKKREPER